MVGAVVGVQPFGGEGLSGTGPKAGGPLYMYRLLSRRPDDAMSRALAMVGKDEDEAEAAAPAEPDGALAALEQWADKHGRDRAGRGLRAVRQPVAQRCVARAARPDRRAQRL